MRIIAGISRLFSRILGSGLGRFAAGRTGFGRSANGTGFLSRIAVNTRITSTLCAGT